MWALNASMMRPAASELINVCVGPKVGVNSLNDHIRNR